MDSSLHIRLPKELKESFQQAAKDNHKDTSTLVRDWIADYVAEHRKTDEETAADLYVAGYRLQQELGGREQIDKDFVKQLQEFSLTDQKQFTHRILSMYLEHDLTVPAIVQKLHGGFAYSQMFLLGLIGEKPKDKV